MKVIFVLSILLGFFLISAPTDAGPIQPTGDIVSKSKIESAEILDLPYKLTSSNEVDTTVLGQSSAVDANAQSTEKSKDDPEKKSDAQPDYSKIPFIPSKGPDFQNLGDPPLPE